MTFKVQDHFFHKAKRDKFLARSVYKLEEIDKKYQVINKGDQVIDLGYHPGSWIQYVSRKIGDEGEVVGIDIKEVNTKLLNEKNVTLFQKSIFDIKGPSDLGWDKKADVVVSDMAPNTTGIKDVDQARSLELVEMVFNSLDVLLKESGHLVVKVFDSNDAQLFLKEQKRYFSKISYLKPKSTRSVSKEFFVIAKGFKK